MNHQTTTDGADISLVSILHILWRRRLIVVGLPLLGLLVGVAYGLFGTRRWSATVTIRPGITAFDPTGGPHREWQLKDITRWYDLMLYRRGLIDRLGLPRSARPVIKAEFVAQGLQNLQGGEVITLWTTATSPDLAAAILDTSLVLFTEYAESDSVSSQLKLTRDGLLLQIERLHSDLTAVDKRAGAIELLLAQARAESLMVAAEDQGYALRLDRLKAQQDYHERRLVDLREAEPRLAQDLTQLDHTLRRVAADGATELDPASLPAGVRRNALLDGGDVLESLTRAKLAVEHALADNRADQDSMAYLMEAAGLEAAQLAIERETAIRFKLREASRKIGDLILERDYDLPRTRRGLASDIAERQVKLDIIAPLQRVGQTEVSDRPVRPRPLRAILILVFLGAIGGLALAFVWDFLVTNRREIFRP
ncbi:MAG: Wzz/FepE/Etk N-terminal domain-containing protein [Candidatus Krumholzibacteriia bacterium]